MAIPNRTLSLLDRLIHQGDQALRTLANKAHQAHRDNPAQSQAEMNMSEEQRQHAAGLMRINHTGEVCAQGLYQGQALTAKLETVREAMEEAAEEEIDHLVWCETRLSELNSQPSLLNPFFYGASFMIGAGAGLISDKMSLGFVAATEDQVCKHLKAHMDDLPKEDLKSQAILEQMYVDEMKHGTQALEAGGYDFPKPIKSLMTKVSKVMTSTTYRI